MVPNGSLNDTSTTCGTTLKMTCDPCYDLEGTGLAVCGTDETLCLNPSALSKVNILGQV